MKHKLISVKIAIIFLIIFSLGVSSCGKKGDDKDDKDKNKKVSDLVKNDGNGLRADLKIAPKVGEKFRYKMSAKTLSKEKSPATKDKEVTSEQVMNYYYTQEVTEISGTGVVTFKMKFDSISISSKASGEDNKSISQVYNSNVKDSVYSMPDFIQYNALIGQDFKLRVSALGEIYDVYELEKIHETIFKTLGDTLSPQDKQTIKESMGSDALKNIIQNQFQKFPGGEIAKDSSWAFNVETSLMVFPIKNILSYKLKDIQTVNGESIATIEANLGIDFIEKEKKDKSGITVKITDSKTGGTGTVSFNLSKGCIAKKETNTNISLGLKMSQGGQSAMSNQTLNTSLLVELL